jgi:hypothetical protein
MAAANVLHQRMPAISGCGGSSRTVGNSQDCRQQRHRAHRAQSGVPCWCRLAEAVLQLGGPRYQMVVFPEGRGFLDYHVVEERQVVVLVDLTWP